MLKRSLLCAQSKITDYIMTDSYINDSSYNESKNSCAKSKLEMAETLLADLNLLNNGSGTSTASGNGIGVGGVGGGVVGSGVYNGTSTTSAASGVNQNNSANNNGNSNNLVVVLLKEISKLHETNKKICRNLHETKVEMEALKHSSHWGLSHRRDSISGLSTNSQPVGMRYNSFGLQSPAPTYHSQGSYSPGLVADVIREIREVSRVREEAMMDRMKTMIEERSWALNETNFRLLKETEEAKKSIHLVRSEMNQMVDRMLKLENEVINLRAQLNNQQLQQQQQQHQQQMHLRERDSYGQASAASSSAKHRRNSMHLNYGRINNTDEFYGGNNFNDLSNDLRYGNGNGSGGGGNLRGSKIEQVPPTGTSASSNTIPSLMGAKSTTTTMSATSALNPAGMVPASGHHLDHHQQQQQLSQLHQYYFRNINNNGSPSQQQSPPTPVGSISPSKLQKAAQIQSIPSPSGKQYMQLPQGAAGTINVSGPVTDL
ncbi:AAEL005440-PA [Aedes aegypti]|uniref:AAEL005440-PA n=1 Tax=Aedes aegypti TaxID=7159 RepID=Q17A15_AEDAE|nr:AAEL005440-PA [Aedes aegypti]